MPNPCTLDPNLKECTQQAELYDLDRTLNAAIQKALEYVEAAEPFVASEMPKLAQEAVRFQIVTGGGCVALAVLLICWGIFAWRWSIRGAVERLAQIDDHDEALNGPFKHLTGPGKADDAAFRILHYGIPASGLLGAFIGVLMFFGNITELLKPLIAPRMYLIEYFRTLIG